MKFRLKGMARIAYVMMVVAGAVMMMLASTSNVYATVSDNTTDDESAVTTPAPAAEDPEAADPAVEPGEAGEPAEDPAEETDPSLEPSVTELVTTPDFIEQPVAPAPAEDNTSFLEIPSDTDTASPMDIDGYYDDWDQVPESAIEDITYGSHNWSGDNIREHHAGKMIIRDGYVYVNIQMSDLYQQQIPTQYLILTIAGKEQAFNILGKDANGNPEWTTISNLAVGRNAGLGIFCNGDTSQIPAGDAAVTTTGRKGGDSFEFRLSIADLENFYGLPEGTIANGAKVEFYSPNIGPQKVTAVGTPTGSEMGIGLCVSITGLALLLSDYKKRKRNED